MRNVRRGRRLGVAMLVAGLVLPATVQAADIGPGGAGQCIGDYRSSILESSSVAEMNAQVTQRYEHALEVSERPTVISSQRQVHTWANEAKVACAKAIGFLKAHEVNEYQISECDCFYGRMYMLLN